MRWRGGREEDDVGAGEDVGVGAGSDGCGGGGAGWLGFVGLGSGCGGALVDRLVAGQLPVIH